MNIRKIGSFALFLILGALIFGIITEITKKYSLLIWIFGLIYLISLVMTFKKYSKKRVILAVCVLLFYALLMSIPFQTSHQTSGIGSVKNCDCGGLKKTQFSFFEKERNFEIQCIGIIKNCECKQISFKDGFKMVSVPCETIPELN